MSNNCYPAFIHDVGDDMCITDTDMLHRCLPCYICTWYRTTSTCHVIVDTRYMTLVLTMLYVIGDTRYLYLPGYTWPRYMTPVLIMLHLTYGAWHRYLPCYIWPMIYDTSICHATFDIWYLRPVLARLYLTHDTGHRYLTCYTCHLIYNTGTCHDIHDTWHLYYLAYSWLLCDQTSGTPVSPVLLYLLSSCTPEPLK